MPISETLCAVFMDYYVIYSFFSRNNNFSLDHCSFPCSSCGHDQWHFFPNWTCNKRCSTFSYGTKKNHPRPTEVHGSHTHSLPIYSISLVRMSSCQAFAGHHPLIGTYAVTFCGFFISIQNVVNYNTSNRRFSEPHITEWRLGGRMLEWQNREKKRRNWWQGIQIDCWLCYNDINFKQAPSEKGNTILSGCNAVGASRTGDRGADAIFWIHLSINGIENIVPRRMTFYKSIT